MLDELHKKLAAALYNCEVWREGSDEHDEAMKLKNEAIEEYEKEVKKQNAENEIKPVLNEDGTIKNFLIKTAEGSFRCHCKCNVFHKPNDKKLKEYQCNSCKTIYEGE